MKFQARLNVISALAKAKISNRKAWSSLLGDITNDDLQKLIDKLDLEIKALTRALSTNRR